MVMVMVMIMMMYYPSNVPAGGITAFPRLGIAAKPELGAAIFWHNIKVTSNIRKNK